MIAWMSEETSRICDKNHISVVGFDPEKDYADARIFVEKGDISMEVCLGNVSYKSPAMIDAAFRKAIAGLIEDGDADDWLAV